MFKTVKELVEQASTSSLFEVIIESEMAQSGNSREMLIEKMSMQLDVMLRSIERGRQGVKSKTGLTGMDAQKLNHYIHNHESICGPTVMTAVQNAIGTNEVNAAMGLICATPTAGSAGVVPGVLSALIERYDLSRQQQIEFLFIAGGFGLVIANNASISGAMGGCQAEVGSASAMAAAATVSVLGGTPQMAADACAMTIKNMLGLICDPVAGLVEVPCVKRNALGASQALVSADMALAGIQSLIPVDEVIATMHKIGTELPSKFRETGEGGLADTPTAREHQQRIFGDNE
ncbi:L-serine ammonia-lyase, iron-sulfur-dependent, subunit alpha [Erysipelothrix inopinata]|uniref:L-serine dehydratase n=1 Tax=Erysipelothrix inopinata TaxID=225084 RepID=A0A7G9RXC5_9FIRM|nr:L-serine ammonia-lyase, iron-sulfur-dependent, subunit alpha [Erysipelothrix inopinata]QNN60250.1 L-serine ammonia-lyase, iron-sulfur-dependent, subunit alpha [Erysipelothrix inopinata]